MEEEPDEAYKAVKARDYLEGLAHEDKSEAFSSIMVADYEGAMQSIMATQMGPITEQLAGALQPDADPDAGSYAAGNAESHAADDAADHAGRHGPGRNADPDQHPSADRPEDLPAGRRPGRFAKCSECRRSHGRAAS